MPVYNDLAQVITSNNTMSVYYDDNLSFGDTTKGYVITSINSYNIYSTCSGIDGEDRIVLGGYRSGGSELDNFLICRYNADGSLDDTFGTGGKVSTDISGNSDSALALVIDSQNRIIVCGYTYLPNSNLVKITVVRYKENGQLDLSFGDNGIVLLSIYNNKYSAGSALTLDSQDRILVSGYTEINSNNASRSNFALIRLTNSGILDNTFGVSGKVETDIRYVINGVDISGNTDRATGIVIDSQDRIVVSGHTYNNINSTVLSDKADFVVVRYTESGQLDTTFGPQKTGMIVTDISNNSNDNYFGINTTIAIDSKDRIVLGGNTDSSDVTATNFAVVRYDSSGNLDRTFGNNGIQITDISGNNNVANAMVIDDQDRIILVGYTVGSYSKFAIIRYNVSGNLDTSFGESGIVVTDINGNSAYGTSVLIDSHNKIVVGGSGYIQSKNQFLIARYNDNGILDIEDRFYNKISLDGGLTWKAIDHYNKFRSQNYKNLLIIPQINNKIDQYKITLKTSNSTVTNTIILANETQQQTANTQSIQEILTGLQIQVKKLGGVLKYSRLRR
jgi:uncharacterized delta-60 repeat protein